MLVECFTMSCRRPLWARFCELALLASFLLVARPASAAPKDAKAEKAFKQAMEDDYLNTNFDDAEKKLNTAITECGSSGCSSRVKARLYVALGTVLIGGKGKKDDGKQAFIDGLKLDANAAPDPDYITSDIKTIFEEAKKGGGSGPSSPGPTNLSSEGMSLIPIAAQKVNTPVPIYVTVDEDAAKKVASITLTYTGTAGGKKEVELEKSGKGFRINIPCGAVKKKGTLKYWVVAKDKKGKESLTIGSSGEPVTTEIAADLNDKPPSWPGFAPPEQCAGGGGGDDTPVEDDSGSSKRQCVDTGDCPSGEQCSGNVCLKKVSASEGGEPPGTGSEDEESKGAKLNWIRLTFAPDFSMISGEDVCGFRDSYGENSPGEAYRDDFVCVKNPEGENKTRYIGQPTVGQGNNVNFGFGVATMRLMLGYDRVLIKGLSVGARLGWAFNGTNEEFASFIPVHAEGNLRYTIGSNPFAGQVVRPWVFISGGLAQVDTVVDVDVLEDGEACGASDPSSPNSECTVDSADGVIEPRIQTLRAIKQAGLGFAGAGVGVSFVPVDLFEINLGVKFSVTIPVVVPVFSPEIGIGFGF